MKKQKTPPPEDGPWLALWPPLALMADLSGQGTRLKATIDWGAPRLNAPEVGAYEVERTVWWPGGAPTTEILGTVPGTVETYVDPAVVPDRVNEYRVRAIHRRFPAMVGPWSFPAAVYGFAFVRYGEMVRELQQLATACPDVCRVVDAGPAASRPYRIWCAVLGTDTGDRPDRPGVFLAGNVHGGEVEGGDVCLALVRRLVHGWREGDPACCEVLKQTQIRIIPIYNPCARACQEAGFPGGLRKTAPARRLVPPLDPLRINHCWPADLSGGLDPNRTFDVNWDCERTENPKGGTYSGTEPNAAPETRALVRMAEALRPQISVNYHGPCGYPLLPGDWPDGSVPTERPLHMAIGREFARRSNPAFANDLPDESPQPTTLRGGVAMTWFYHRFHGAHLLPEGFCGQVPGDPRLIPVAGAAHCAELAESNFAALLWLARRAAGAGIAIHVRDAAGQPLAATVEIEGHTDPHCRPWQTDSDHGGGHRLLEPGVYALRVSCPGYRVCRRRGIRVEDGKPSAVEVVLRRQGGRS